MCCICVELNILISFSVGTMRPDQGSPLDLNNLPEDYLSRDGKQVFDHDGSTGYRKKKSGGKDAKDECGKVYECRFCSLKFCKSQALGGHMNRHRQERETETLNRARQLVFSNDNLAAQGHLSCCHPMTPPGTGAGYHHPTANMGVVSDSSALPMRFPTRMFSGSSSSNFAAPPPPPSQQVVQPSQPPPYTLYNSSNRPMPFSSHYPPPPHDYYVGHVLGSTTNSSSQYCHPSLTYASDSSYTCIGAPVGHGFGSASNGGGGRGGSTELAEPGGSSGGGSRGGGPSLL